MEVYAVYDARGQKTKSSSYSFYKHAAHIAELFEASFIPILFCPDPARTVKEIRLYRQTRILAVCGESSTDLVETLASKQESLINEPALILFRHDANGLDTAPALASRLAIPCITGVSKVMPSNGGIVFSRLTAYGKKEALIRADNGSICATLRAKAIDAEKGFAPTSYETITPAKRPPLSIRHLGFNRICRSSSDLLSADIIVSAGLGCQDQDGVDLVKKLAAVFPHSTVAGSRPACDMGWIPHERQIGETGTVVAPELYIACGISGAPQHIAGIEGSGCIVSINIDPNAPIRRNSDFFVTEDLKVFLPILIDTLINTIKKA